MSILFKKFVNIARVIIPRKLFNQIRIKRQEKENTRFLKKLTSQVLKFHKNTNDNEVIEVLNFLENNPISVFPYNYIHKYKKEEIEVELDHAIGLKYIIHENKKLYFKRSMSVNAIKSLYRGLLIDQDIESPHLYLTEGFKLTSQDVIADIGAAEGNFSLSNVEHVKKAYLFESDSEWIEALQATFKPWKDKVEIINSFVTNYDSDSTVNISTFYKKHNDISFFKVDIEGEEQNFLNACVPIFKENSNIKLAICTYHKHNDEVDFTKQLKSLNFKVKHSKGYMLYFYDKSIRPPYFRRGLLRASK